MPPSTCRYTYDACASALVDGSASASATETITKRPTNIDTPPLNNIPDDIRATEEIDSAISALTSHVRTVVGKCEWEVPASSDRQKYPPEILELIRAINAALRRANAYSTPEYQSRTRPLQRKVKTRVQEFRNESWSNVMEEIVPTYKAFWKVTKALKTEGYTPIPSLKKSDNYIALDDMEIAENCYFPPAWKEAEVIDIHKPGKPRDLPASYRPISLLSGLGKLFDRILKTGLSDQLFGKALSLMSSSAFAQLTPAHTSSHIPLTSPPTTKDHTSTRTRLDVLSEQEFFEAPPSFPCCTPRIQTIYRDRRLAFNSRYSRTIPRSILGVEHPMAGCKLPYLLRGQCSSRDEARVRGIGLYPHLHPLQGVEDPRTNEPSLRFNWSKLNPSNWSLS
ncbi:Probable RNA-directed DNA polymerase from transposon X-element [Eumeta japonica]|uniref:Probable RNA-directed DNA polymerase from transposon X-element n=1 Tax=Eumeta variegata TaxID=151549 RepID=A0A4C1WDZ7_EUMVA|nr:Probable RNA-directed DNA polymerase from transposon X-element [Eumeta japonica]